MMKLRLIEQACGCSTMGGRLKVGARLCLWQCGRRVLAAQMKHLEVVWLLHRSRHDEAPTDRASLRLLHGARQTQGACSSLPLAVRAESACCTDEAPGGGLAFISLYCLYRGRTAM